MARTCWDATTRREKSYQRSNHHGAEGRPPEVNSRLRSRPIVDLARHNRREYVSAHRRQKQSEVKIKWPVEAAGAVKMWKTKKRFPTIFTSALENSPAQK